MIEPGDLFEVCCKDGVVLLDLETDHYFCRFAAQEGQPTPEPALQPWQDPPPLPRDVGVGVGDVLRFAVAYVSALATFPGRSVRTLAETGSIRRGSDSEPDVHVVARRFERLSLYLPVRPACLLASYALRRYLRLYGRDADWIIGVQLFPFRAHCWLAIDQILLAERAHLIEDYKPIVRFERAAS
jgi:hypothetical protein